MFVVKVCRSRTTRVRCVRQKQLYALFILVHTYYGSKKHGVDEFHAHTARTLEVVYACMMACEHVRLWDTRFSRLALHDLYVLVDSVVVSDAVVVDVVDVNSVSTTLSD